MIKDTNISSERLCSCGKEKELFDSEYLCLECDAKTISIYAQIYMEDLFSDNLIT